MTASPASELLGLRTELPTELLGLRRSRSTDPRLSPRGPLMQLETGLIVDTAPIILAATPPSSLLTPPGYRDKFIKSNEPLVSPPPKPVEPMLRSSKKIDSPPRSPVRSADPVAAETWSDRLERSRTYSRFADPLRSARLLDPPHSVTDATDASAFSQAHFGNPLKSGSPHSRVETKGYRDINGDLVTTRIDQTTGEKTVSVQDSLGRVRSSARPITPGLGDRARSQEPFRKTVTEQCLDEFRSPAWKGRGDGLLAGRTLWPRPLQNFDDPAWNRPAYPDRHAYRNPRYLDDPLWTRSMAYMADPLRRHSPPYLENPFWHRRSVQVGLV